MKECDILGGQNILWPLLHRLRGSRPPTRQDLRSCMDCWSTDDFPSPWSVTLISTQVLLQMVQVCTGASLAWPAHPL